MTMTDTAFAPGQTRSDVETQPSGGTPPARNKKLLLIVGGAVVLVLGLVAAFLLLSGGSSDSPQVVVPSASQPGSGTAAKPSTPPSAVVPAAVPVRKHDFRDPFKVLLKPAAASDVVPGSGAVAPATGTTGSTGASGSTGTTGTGTTGTSTSTAPKPSTSHRVQIMSVAANNTTITIKIDGKTYSGLKAGEVFATYFKVIGIGGAVNVVQYGDVKFSIAGTKAVTIAS